MVANQKVSGRAVSIPAGLGIGLGVSLLVTVLFAAMTAYLEGKGVIRETGVGYSVMLTLLLSALLGAITAAKKIKRKRAVMCAASSLCYFLALISMTALLFGGQYEGVAITAVVIFGASAAAILVTGRGRKSTTVRKKKFKNR